VLILMLKAGAALQSRRMLMLMLMPMLEISQS
jgi:hypothetical protein